MFPGLVQPMKICLERRGYQGIERIGSGKIGPVISDEGFIIMDAVPKEGMLISDIESLVVYFNSIPGLIEHGIFMNMATSLIIGFPNGSSKCINLRESKL